MIIRNIMFINDILTLLQTTKTYNILAVVAISVLMYVKNCEVTKKEEKKKEQQ